MRSRSDSHYWTSWIHTRLLFSVVKLEPPIYSAAESLITIWTQQIDESVLLKISQKRNPMKHVFSFAWCRIAVQYCTRRIHLKNLFDQ